MIAPDRRTFLGAALTALILPALSPFPARAASGRTGFNPPSGPMRYSRRLERGLAGGARFVVDRDFAIRFLPIAGGFRVEGKQIAVTVDAPGQLAAFAKMEREKVEHGLFPLTLDDAGLIAGSTHGNDQRQLEKSVKETLARLGQLPYDAAELSEMQAFVQAVRQTAADIVTELPGDLFAPTEARRAARRELALPDGGSGFVSTTFTAETDPQSGLMRAARREVLTDISGDTRRTLESWQLAPIG